jgi:hypothetical protein
MNKKIKENEVALNYKDRKEPDFVVKIPTTGNKEPVITEIYKAKVGGLLDVNTATNSIPLTVTYNPFSFSSIRQLAGRAIRTGTLLGGTSNRFPLRSSRETTKYVNTVIKKLLVAEKVQRPAQLIEKFKQSNLVRSEFTAQQTYLEAGMVLKRLGISPREILSLICERILQRKDLKQKYLSRNSPSLEGFGSPVKLEGQAGYELIYQWHLIGLQNYHNSKRNWKSRPPKYKKKKFYISNTFNEWCIKYGVPKPSTYSYFIKFINNLVKDYKKFCRQNKKEILPFI